MQNQKVKTATAAKILGLNPFSVGEFIKIGGLPIGSYRKREGASRGSIYVNLGQLAKYLNISNTQLEKLIEEVEGGKKQ